MTPVQTARMNHTIPTKPAFRIHPGEMLMDGDPAMVTGVTWRPARNEVSLSLGKKVKTYRMEDRVPCLPQAG